MDFGVDDDEAVARLADRLVDDVPFRGGHPALRGVVLVPRVGRGRGPARLRPRRPDRRPPAASTSRCATARATSRRCAGRSTSCAGATGPSAVATVAELGPDGLSVEPRRREDAWGPAEEAR